MPTNRAYERHALVGNSQSPCLGATTQATHAESPALARLEMEDFHESPARKRKAVDMDAPEEGQIVSKREMICGHEPETLDHGGVGSSKEEVGQFLQSLEKELEGSDVSGMAFVKTEFVDEGALFV